MSKYLAAILIVPAAVALSGSFDSQPTAPQAAAEREMPREQALRVTFDLARGRRWELHWDGVLAYDMASGELVRHVRLPGATFSAARESCLPGILLGRSGDLMVSSNAQPRLWRVSPARFEVEVYDLALAIDDDKDFGFGKLAWSPGARTLDAVSSPMGATWRIDLSTATAIKLGASAPGGVATCL